MRVSDRWVFFQSRSTSLGHEIERNNCVNLITRIEDMLNATELACVFRPGKTKAIFDEMESFIADRDTRALRISLKYLPFVHDVREIIANAAGRHALGLARSGKLGNRPLLLFLDEAHNFLNKRLADEDTGYRLDSFEQIAKEGRKVSLNICIATQRPRDIPEGVLSQIGTFIVHRLSNHKDRVAVESASSEADRTVMAFVPALREGQAVVIGADVPIPLAVQITKPTQEPDSRGPDYQTQWR
jgi:DNA helicase HerA-like ATPase